MKNIDLTKLLKGFKTGWIAVSDDYSRVIDHAEKFTDLQDKIKNKKNIVVIQASRNYYDFVS